MSLTFLLYEIQGLDKGRDVRVSLGGAVWCKQQWAESQQLWASALALLLVKHRTQSSCNLLESQTQEKMYSHVCYLSHWIFFLRNNIFESTLKLIKLYYSN